MGNIGHIEAILFSIYQFKILNIFWIYAFPISLTGIIVKFLSPYPSTE